MKKLCFVLIMVLTAFFLMGCPNPVKEVEDVDLPTEEEVLEMYKDWYISKSNEQANLRSSESGSTVYTVDNFMEIISKFSVNVNNCHLKYAKGENSLELWLEENELFGLLNKDIIQFYIENAQVVCQGVGVSLPAIIECL